VAIDIFAKLGDIKGESLDDKHKDEIEVLSWSWGVTNGVSVSGTGAGQGKASFHDLSFTHKIDKASPVLMQACATGVHLKEATITELENLDPNALMNGAMMGQGFGPGQPPPFPPPGQGKK